MRAIGASGVASNPPGSPGLKQTSPVARIRLQKSAPFGNVVTAKSTIFRLRRYAGPPLRGVLLLWSGIPLQFDYGMRANDFARELSVPQNTVVFKEAAPKPSDSRHLRDTVAKGAAK